ncbi:hypothetical protein DMR38_04915 [Clostridium sp. AWRP]|nr:hypothetical protein DMR38_04915 [Clostridium sp. AWRP]
MILMNKDSMVNGNTVLQPEYKPYKETEEKKIKTKAPNRALKVKKKLRVIRNICVIFIVGVILVYRYCAIYNSQTELNSIENDISEINKQNENLRVELVKYNNLGYIEDNAINKLQMKVPDKGNAVYINLDKKIIKVEENSDESEMHKGILNELKQLIWR